MPFSIEFRPILDRTPIMQGSTEQQQLKLITQLCGAITPLSWPCVERLELYGRMEMPRDGRRRVKDRLRPYVKDQGSIHLT